MGLYRKSMVYVYLFCVVVFPLMVIWSWVSPGPSSTLQGRILSTAACIVGLVNFALLLRYNRNP
jgi:hypothetical protein